MFWYSPVPQSKDWKIRESLALGRGTFSASICRTGNQAAHLLCGYLDAHFAFSTAEDNKSTEVSKFRIYIFPFLKSVCLLKPVMKERDLVRARSRQTVEGIYNLQTTKFSEIHRISHSLYFKNLHRLSNFKCSRYSCLRKNQPHHGEEKSNPDMHSGSSLRSEANRLSWREAPGCQLPAWWTLSVLLESRRDIVQQAA